MDDGMDAMGDMGDMPGIDDDGMTDMDDMPGNMDDIDDGIDINMLPPRYARNPKPPHARIKTASMVPTNAFSPCESWSASRSLRSTAQ